MKCFDQGNLKDFDYYEKFKELVAVVHSKQARFCSDQVAINKELQNMTLATENTPTEAEINIAKEAVKQRYLARLFVMNWNSYRHSKFAASLENNYAKGFIRVYPDTVDEAYSRMTNYKQG